MKHHLTYTGYDAGKTLCGDKRAESGKYFHAAYCPIDLPDFRTNCCKKCLETYCRDAYDDGEEMPDWVSTIRDEIKNQNAHNMGSERWLA